MAIGGFVKGLLTETVAVQDGVCRRARLHRRHCVQRITSQIFTVNSAVTHCTSFTGAVLRDFGTVRVHIGVAFAAANVFELCRPHLHHAPGAFLVSKTSTPSRSTHCHSLHSWPSISPWRLRLFYRRARRRHVATSETPENDSTTENRLMPLVLAMAGRWKSAFAIVHIS